MASQEVEVCIFRMQRIFPNAFVVDGDDVRKYVSTDLSYSEIDRKFKPIVFSVSKIVIQNKMFPIISTVTMQSDLLVNAINFKLK